MPEYKYAGTASWYCTTDAQLYSLFGS